MGRNIGPSCRQCRREGEKLFLKGTRCFTHKCAIERRAYAPGQHGAKRTKLSNFGIQLREKQKVKRIYGLQEMQFRSYFERAARTKGVTGFLLLQLLERRLDNVLYQMGFALSRKQGRQFISHGLITVNDEVVNIASFLVKANDEIAVKFTGEAKIVKDNVEASKQRTIPSWLEVDGDHLKGKIARMPERDDITFPVNEQLIVELYSR